MQQLNCFCRISDGSVNCSQRTRAAGLSFGPGSGYKVKLGVVYSAAVLLHLTIDKNCILVVPWLLLAQSAETEYSD